MRKSLTFISLLLALLFIVSASAIIVCHAEPDDADPPAEGYDDNNNNVDIPDDPDNTGDDNNVSSNVPIENDNTGAPADDPNNTGVVTNNNNYDDEPDWYEDEEPLVYGNSDDSYYYNISDGVVSEEDVITNSNPVKTSNTNDADMKPIEWTDVKMADLTGGTKSDGLKEIKLTDSANDGSDNSLSSIKNGEGNDAKWMVYVGYSLIVLSALAILYFLFGTISQASKYKNAVRLNERRRSSDRPLYDETEPRPNNRAKSKSSRHASTVQDRSHRASSKANTGEIYIPRRAAKRSR